jgi:hypothetical protein
MQQEFDAVVQHLYKQGRPAKDELGTCYYRSPEGLSCAVGCRIPDEMYRKSMEGTCVSALSGVPRVITEYEDMFDLLQYAHDSCRTNKDGKFHKGHLKRKLMEVAENVGVDFKESKL